MKLIILSLFLGVFVGIFITKAIKKKKLFNNFVLCLTIILLIFGLNVFFFGVKTNFKVVDANGGKMPIDKNIALKYLDTEELNELIDNKHKLSDESTLYSDLIDKYYVRGLVFKSGLYSIGDIVACCGIFVIFSIIESLVNIIFVRIQNYKRKISIA
ncbi:DUF5317 family protein [Clostridium sp. UBA6640]|uniref:DUF5317 family protein n=1 Tax=Clostridium sp. UBA6640 TaxID=1946370 RepID=UPI0025BB022F|nr:DUF5317 family protein [Clostridium sp. UBA6640]